MAAFTDSNAIYGESSNGDTSTSNAFAAEIGIRLLAGYRAVKRSTAINAIMTFAGDRC